MPAAGDPVEITSDGDGWSLNYLEVANVHGFSRGLFEFMIVPAAATRASPVGVPPSVALFVLMLRFRRHPAGALRRRTVRVSYVVAAAFVYLFLAAILVAPLVSDYGVLVAWHTFVVLLAVLYYTTRRWTLASGEPSRRCGRRPSTFSRHCSGRGRQPGDAASPCSMWLRSCCSSSRPPAFMTLRPASPPFIHFGTRAADEMVPGLRDVPLRVVPNSPGYDGQFYAQLAVDPLLLDAATGEALDNPSYRARRILFSWTAFLIGLGQPRLVVHACAIQNALFWVVLALLLMRWFPAQDFRSFCLWFGCMFGHGAIVSVVWALPDGPSLLFLGLGVLGHGTRANPACRGARRSRRSCEGHQPVLLPMTVAFNAVLPRNRWFWPLLFLGNLTVINALHELKVVDWVVMLEGLETLDGSMASF